MDRRDGAWASELYIGPEALEEMYHMTVMHLLCLDRFHYIKQPVQGRIFTRDGF